MKTKSFPEFVYEGLLNDAVVQIIVVLMVVLIIALVWALIKVIKPLIFRVYGIYTKIPMECLPGGEIYEQAQWFLNEPLKGVKRQISSFKEIKAFADSHRRFSNTAVFTQFSKTEVVYHLRIAGSNKDCFVYYRKRRLPKFV